MATSIASVGGLATGLDTAGIIDSLVAVERQAEDPIKSRATSAQNALTGYASIRADLAGVSTAANNLSSINDWRQLTATSSSSAVSAVGSSGTFGGSLSFNVDTLATAGSFRSVNTFSGTTAAVAADKSILIASGGLALGFSTLASNDALTAGPHTISVTQASSAALKHGDATLAGSTVIDGTNDSIDLEVNGAPVTLTLAHGTYTASALAAAVQGAATGAGVGLTASVNSTTNKLELATTRQGSQASLKVMGGSALAALGVNTDATAATGTDGVVTVDGGTAQTFSQLEAGDTITLNAASGAITAVLGGGLKTGSLTATNVDVGDGSLGTVVGSINGAQTGVTATAVQVGTNLFRLQIASNTTGALAGANVAASEFNSATGGFVTLNDAADAQLTVGTGSGSYTVTSSTNTVTGLMPGVTLTLNSATTSPVTVSVSRDSNALADKVQALVDAANGAKKDIDSLTAYDTETLTSSALTGDANVARLMSALTRAITDAVPGAAPGSPGLAGLSVDKTGAFTFDRAKFTTAYNANPEGLAKLFTQGGTATTSDITFVSAGDRAVAGTYDVNVTQVALKATSVGLTGTWPTGTTTPVKVTVNGTTVSYDVKPTDTQDDVAAGLNAAFAGAGFSLNASISGTGIQVSTNDYGSGAKFSVAWDGTNFTTQTGQDVAGTINGTAATGKGQQLLVPFGDQTLGGLALNVTATTTGAIGSFTYTPGVAARVTTALNSATDLVSGYITSSETDYKTRIEYINDSVASMELRINAYEANLKSQFATLEATIGQMKTQSQWLSTSLGQLPSSSGSSGS